MAAFKRTVKLSVFNDLVCPNCCIGQHELLTAISYCQDTLQLPIQFEIEFLPFRLISQKCLPEDAPKMPKPEFFIKVLGSSYYSIAASVQKWAEQNGVPISFNGVICQSTQGHRLSRKAYLIGGQKLQVPLLCALYREHLENGKDISDFDVLSDIAAENGIMSKDEAMKFLQSGELLDEVNKMCETAKEQGITGVPYAIIDGKWGVAGGQSSDIFVKIFKKLADTDSVSAAPSPMPMHLAAPSHSIAYAQSHEDVLTPQVC